MVSERTAHRKYTAVTCFMQPRNRCLQPKRFAKNPDIPPQQVDSGDQMNT